jgi:DNA repair protein SbcC/Rad50
MKILRISGAGIRSLAGSFEVDFTSGPLAGGGLFAIVGPTGAGKSTLLDAMCLALYGRVPRVPGKVGGVRITDGEDSLSESDPRTCLSHGVGEGHAEVRFEVGGRKYQASWKVHRSRKKPGGKLQNDRMELTDRTGQVSLADKKTDVVAQVEELTGLDFDQFQRSVLLAQGQFARFLQADEKERAGLLETITGQTIYSKLSVAAYLRAQCFKEELQKLKIQQEALELPSPEAIAEVAEQLAVAKSEQRETTATMQKYQAALRWFVELDALKELLIAADADVAGTELAWQDFAPELELLERAARARELRAEVTAVEHAESALERASKEQELARQDGIRSGGALELARKVQQENLQALANLKAEKEKLKLEVVKARGLDGRLAMAEKVLADSQSRLDFEGERHVTATRKLAALQATSGKLQAKSIELDEWFAKNRGLEPLVAQHQQVKKHLRDLVTSIVGETELGAELAAATRAEQNEQKRLTSVRGKMADLTAELALSLELSGDGETLPFPAVLTEALAAERKAAAEALELVRVARVKSERVSGATDLRQTLVAGEACPVCGSMDHPFVKEGAGPPTLSGMQEKEEDAKRRVERGENLLAWKEELDRLRVAAAELEVLVNGAASDLADRQKMFAENGARGEAARAALEPLLGAWRSTWEADDPAELESELESLEIAWHARQVDGIAVDRQLRGMEPALAVAAAAVESSTENLPIAQEALALAAAKQQELVANRGELLSGRPVDEVLEKWEEVQQQADGALSQAVEGEAKARSEAAAAATRLKIARAARESAVGVCKQAGKNFQVALKRVGLQAPDVTDLLARGEDWFQTLQQRRDDLVKRQATAQQTVLVRKAEVARHDSREDRPEVAREEMEELAEVAAAQALDLDGRVQELFARQRGMEERQAKAQQLVADRDKLAIEADPWLSLNDMIGSADGSKFKKFAQGLALVQLLRLANEQMMRLKPRYHIMRVPESDLEIAILDRDQASQIRPVSSLSGGETFLVSLALALGLAQLTGGGSPLQSLFIDEGFGALDQESLDDALETLDRLQSEGKTIGVISHVEAISERTACKIEITPVGAGRSELSVSF